MTHSKALTDRAEKEYVGIIKGILLQKDINAGKDNYTGPGSGLSEYAYQLERIVDSIRDEDTLHGIVLLHRLIMAGLSEIGAGKLVECLEMIDAMTEDTSIAEVIKECLDEFYNEQGGDQTESTI